MPLCSAPENMPELVAYVVLYKKKAVLVEMKELQLQKHSLFVHSVASWSAGTQVGGEEKLIGSSVMDFSLYGC